MSYPGVRNVNVMCNLDCNDQRFWLNKMYLYPYKTLELDTFVQLFTMIFFFFLILEVWLTLTV